MANDLNTPASATIPCTWEEFKRIAKEFHNSAPSLNITELDQAWACLGLAYVGMTENQWHHSAAAVLRLEALTYFNRVQQLNEEYV